MYEDMNNKVAKSIKIMGNVLGVFGVIVGLITLINDTETVLGTVSSAYILFNGVSVLLNYIIIMFIFWGLAEIIELLSVIKANTTNQVELFSQKNISSPSHNNNPDTNTSEDL